MKRCTKCGAEKPLSAFGRKGKGRWQSRCKTCCCEDAKRYPKPRIPPEQHRRRGKPKRWTQAALVTAMQQWERERGRPPGANDWRKGGPYWPTTNTVLQECGSWNACIIAAGFEPMTNGHRRCEQH